MPHSYFSSFSRSTLIILALGCSHSALAQVPVVEAGVSRTQATQAQAQSQPQTTSPAAGNNTIMLQMYDQIEQLKRELSDLRGLVEQQSYQIRQMQNEQRDRYLDLDRRVSELTTDRLAGAAPGQQPGGLTTQLPVDSRALPGQQNMPPATAGQNQTAEPAGAINANPGASTLPQPGSASPATRPGGLTVSNLPSSQPAGAQPAVSQISTPAGSEQDVYRDALNLLLEEGKYEEAIAGFDNYVQAFPGGRYLANAYYWQGEAMILAERYAQAERVFRKVVDEYPTDPKAADAMLKLGVVYNQTGNRARAREVWESIRTTYPDSLAAIRAADDYLSRL